MTFKELLKSPFVKEYDWIRSDFAIIAPHGGGIEPGTEQIARFLAKHLEASLYVCSGRLSHHNWDLHVTSKKITLGDSPILSKIISSCKTGIAIHGHARNDYEVYVTGTNTKLLNKVAIAARDLLGSSYSILTQDDDLPDSISYFGESGHFLNHFKDGAVQIELPKNLRHTFIGEGFNRHENERLFGETKDFFVTLAGRLQT